MATIALNYYCDLNQAVKVQYIDGNVFSGDNAGNTISVFVMDGDQPATIGGSVSADVIRADGSTVAVSGALDGNRAYVILPQACYAVPGPISIVIKNTQNTTITTIAALVGNVYRSSTDEIVDPGTIIPSIQSLISAIETAVASIPADYSSLWTSLAPAFNSSTNYVAGQYVTNNGGLYRFTKAHSGEWSSSDVVATNLGGDISDLKSALDYVEDSIGCAKKKINKSSISSSGEIETSSNRELVCYQVEAGAIITATGTFDLYGFFESEPDDGSQTYNDSRTIASAINNVVVPAGCKWIAIRQQISNSDVQISPKGKVVDSLTKLSNVSNEIINTLIDINAENIDLFSYKNIFIKGTVVEGKVRTASGVESASELYFISDYFRIDKNTEYIFSLDPAADLATRVYNTFLCFYDINYQYISGSTLQSGSTPITNTFTTPVNAVYASVSTRIIFEDAIQIEKGSTITSYEPPMSVIHSSAQLAAKNTPPVFYVDKNGGADFTSLVRAIDRAENFIGAKIYVAPGTYDLIDELKDFYGDSYFDNISASSSERQGIQLKNRVHIIFSSRSKVTAKYTGSNQYVKQKFSAFNANELGFTLENMRLETANTRYCIHDERSVATDQYINVYKNCKMKQDNSENTDWLGKACIGGGLGTNGEVLVENCIFESVGAGQTTKTKYLVSYHNSSDSGNVGARSNVVITGNYFKDACSIKCSWYGNSEDITTFVISNNSIGAAIKIHAEGDNPELTQNIEVFEWNNVIRS